MRPTHRASLVTGPFLGLVIALGVLIVPPAVHADEPDPVDQLLSPTLLDPVIGLLAALPTPYRPYTGDICADGDPRCIDRVIREMEQRLRALGCDHDSAFALAYLRVTQNVQAAVESGWFEDRAWLTQVDAVFAEMYFDTLDAWDAGDEAAVPHAWRIALQASDERTMSGLGDFMLGMNAHINNDFPHVLAEVGLTAADGSTHKPDHNAYNARLDQLYHPVFAEEAARYDPRFDDFDLGPADELVVSSIMRGWREMVWRHAEALANAPTPAIRRHVAREIEEYAAGQALLIQRVPIFRASYSPDRDAWCAAHG